MVNQIKGQTFLTVKQHFDDMKRATLRTLDYFYHPLVNTPFTLGIALPQEYGKWRVDGRINVQNAGRGRNLSELLEGDDWRVHPDWVYCQYNYAGDDDKEFATPEDEARHFVAKMQKSGWNWGTPSVQPLPTCTGDQQVFNPNCIKCKHECH